MAETLSVSGHMSCLLTVTKSSNDMRKSKKTSLARTRLINNDTEESETNVSTHEVFMHVPRHTWVNTMSSFGHGAAQTPNHDRRN
jgi:hypothetical protein